MAALRTFSDRCVARPALSDGAHLDDLRNVVPEHVLDARLERGRRARAAGAGAAQLEVDHPLLEAPEDDVAAVLGAGGAPARPGGLAGLTDAGAPPPPP